MAAQTHADGNDLESRFHRHFPFGSTDFALVVLKGHLLLEENVNRLLAALLRKPEAIEGANLRFRQKLCLIRALIPSPDVRVMDAAEKLNTLRNALAHRLDYPQLEAQVRDFLSLWEVKDWLTGKKPDREGSLIFRLMTAIVGIYVEFQVMAAAEEDHRSSSPNE